MLRPEQLREIRRMANERHRENTLAALRLLQEDADLSRLHTVIEPTVAEIYRRVLPRHAELCEIRERRKLTDLERCQPAIGYGSLYPTFGDEGIVALAATWLATKPIRQARYS